MNAKAFEDELIDDEVIVELKRTTWRGWFLQSIPFLDGMTPVEASKSVEGTKKLDALFALYGQMSANTPADGLCVNPPRDWARWRLGLDIVADGAARFAKEEAIFKGSDGDATVALYISGGVVADEGGKNICNFCSKKMDRPLVCGRCRCRRYCSTECQKKEWKEHKKYCVPNGGHGPKKERGTSEEEWQKLKEHVIKHTDPSTLTDWERANFEARPPSWAEFLERGVSEGIISRQLVDDEKSGRGVDVKKKVIDELYGMYFKIVCPLPKVGEKERETQQQLKRSFDGHLQPQRYHQLPQREAGWEITFSCVMLDKKTGMKEFFVMVSELTLFH
jgi:MYND finger